VRGETIAVVDDEKLIRWSLTRELQRLGFRTAEAATLGEARALLVSVRPDLVLLDQMLPDGHGLDLLRELRQDGTAPPVIMLTAVDRATTAVEAMKLGASDYLTKPVDRGELGVVLDRVLDATRLRRQVAHMLHERAVDRTTCGMIGQSAALRDAVARIVRVAASPGTTVLITGESGTGKELAARAVHALGARADRPMMTVNCAAIPETLIESELFGHEKGAFTDAQQQRKGVFELAHGGSVFLDEIGDIPLRVQVKLLRVLENRVIQRVGGTAEIAVDVRIIAATNQPLDERVAGGEFRSDLFFRLNVARIHLPALREREGDVLLLAGCFLQEFSRRFHRGFRTVTPAAAAVLSAYPWPGNIRELRNVLERAVLLHDAEELSTAHLEFTPLRAAPDGSRLDVPIGEEGVSLEDLERKALIMALEKAHYNKTRAARLLRISRDELRYKVKKHRIHDPSAAPPDGEV
jgi:DNA-binding NtrC family response regulator